MRGIICGLFIALVCGAAFAEAAPKTHTFKRSELPKSIKAKAGDKVVVVEEVAPSDVEELTSTTTNNDIKVRTNAGGNKLEILINCEKKGKGKVGWKYQTAAGTVGGVKEIEIEID